MRNRISRFAGVALLTLSAGASAGGFEVRPPQVESAAIRAEARRMQDSGTLQELAATLNTLLDLPATVGMRFAECGEDNAYYDSEKREVLMCVELMAGMAKTLDEQFETEEEEADALAGAFVAIVLHEVGHALVDVLQLPVTGREEDAVDQLAAWMLIESGEVDSVLGAAATYYTDDEVGDEDFAGEHSLNKQRYFNMVCWAYGSDPDNSQPLIDDWELPSDRAEGCSEEYALLDRSWSRLLKEHLRPGASPGGEGTRITTTRSLPPPTRGGDEDGEDEGEEAVEYADADDSSTIKRGEVRVTRGGDASDYEDEGDSEEAVGEVVVRRGGKGGG